VPSRALWKVPREPPLPCRGSGAKQLQQLSVQRRHFLHLFSRIAHIITLDRFVHTQHHTRAEAWLPNPPAIAAANARLRAARDCASDCQVKSSAPEPASLSDLLVACQCLACGRLSGPCVTQCGDLPRPDTGSCLFYHLPRTQAEAACATERSWTSESNLL
jgi:hypothetical protein